MSLNIRIPIVKHRNFAEPRVFVTKWEKEINDKHKRKKAIHRDRDSKFNDTTKNEFEVFKFDLPALLRTNRYIISCNNVWLIKRKRFI